MKGNTVLILGAVAAVAALWLTWPMINIAMLKKKQGIIVDGDTLHDTESGKYWNTATGALIWQPGM